MRKYAELPLKFLLFSSSVSLYKVNKSSSNGSGFHLYSNCCSAPVRFKKVCGQCGNELAAEDISKGIQADKESPPRIFSPEELAELEVEGKKLEILSFSKEFFYPKGDRWWIIPADEDDEFVALLYHYLRKKRLQAVGILTLRGTSSWVRLTAANGGLMAEKIFTPLEVADRPEWKPRKIRKEVAKLFDHVVQKAPGEIENWKLDKEIKLEELLQKPKTKRRRKRKVKEKKEDIYTKLLQMADPKEDKGFWMKKLQDRWEQDLKGE